MGGVAINGASPTITNNNIQDNIACGIIVDGFGSPTIQGNHIWLNRFPTATDPPVSYTCGPRNGFPSGTGLGVYMGGTVTVKDNFIEQNTTGPIYQLGGSSSGIELYTARELLLVGNIIEKNGYNDSPNDEVGLLSFGYTGTGSLVLLQNRIRGTVDFAGALNPPYPNLTMVNNTLSATVGLVANYASGSVFENNIIYGETNNPTGTYALTCSAGVPFTQPITFSHNDNFIVQGTLPSGCPLDSTNLQVDPQFVDPDAYNFHTARTSPVVAAGDIHAPGIQPEDMDHKNRTVCGTIDMGVYEVHPQPPISIRSSSNPSVGGSSVTFTAQLTGNCNVPTGSITFYDGATSLGTVALSPGAAASISTSSLTVGTHTITAAYPGDFNFDPNTSAPLVQVVTGFPTSTTLTVSLNPAVAFNPVSLYSTVTSSFGAPTGTVLFTANGQPLATATLGANGVASTSVATLGAGAYMILATYSADTKFASSSASVNEVVQGAASVTSLTASPNPATLLQAVVLNAMVRAAQGSVVPSGMVTFSDGSNAIGTATLDISGRATFSTSTLSAGQHTLTATYAASGNFNASSASTSETITTIGTSVTLSASPNPAGVGQPVTLTAHASSSAGAVVSSGPVTFYDGATVLGTASVNSTGQASLTTSTLALGSHTLTAGYEAGATFGSSTSASVQEVIEPYTFTVSLAPATIAIHDGKQGQVLIQLASTGFFSGPLTLSYGALPQYASASLSTSSVTLTAGGTGTSTLSFNTLAEASLRVPAHAGPMARPIALAASLLLLLPLGCVKKRRVRLLLGVVFAGAAMQGVTGCGSSYTLVHVVPAGTYQVPITATDSNHNAQTANLTIVVAP